ncbi:MAG: AAA family ATPase [Alphaproteobacteria bacterium]|nr:AAA family ATPase [Alphaproteobacteria bacterium]
MESSAGKLFQPVDDYEELGAGMPRPAVGREQTMIAYLVAGILSSNSLRPWEEKNLLNTLRTSLLRPLLQPQKEIENIDRQAERKAALKAFLEGEDDEEGEVDEKSEKQKRDILAIYNACCDTLKESADIPSLEKYYPALSAIKTLYKLSDRQTFLLGFFAFSEQNDAFQSLIFSTINLSYNHKEMQVLCERLMARLSIPNEAQNTIQQDLHALSELGLLFRNEEASFDSPSYKAAPYIRRALYNVTENSPVAAIAAITGDPANAEYPISHWLGYVKGLPRLIRAVQAKSKKAGDGVPALVFGAPGVGKTEAIKALSDATGKPVFFVTTQSGDDKDPKAKPSEIIANLKMLLKLIPHLPQGAIICIDDAEAIFAKDQAAGQDSEDPVAKRYFNELIDAIRASGQVVLMAVNDKDKIPDSVLSRMGMEVEFPYPPAKFRRIFFETQSKLHSLNFNDEQLTVLAKRFSPPIRMIGVTAALIARTGEEFQAFVDALQEKAEAEFGSRGAISAPLPMQTLFMPELINERENNLTDVFKKMVGEGQVPEVSQAVIIAGGSGTGKTLFAHSLAAVCGVEIETLDGRDVMVASEKNPTLYERRRDPAAELRRAFKNAHEHGRVLVIENIDVLAPNVTQNTTGVSVSYSDTIDGLMSRYPVRVVFTTQSQDNNLDPALFRSVPEVLCFDPLSEGQAKRVVDGLLEGGAAFDIPDDVVASDIITALERMTAEDGNEAFGRYLESAVTLRKKGISAPHRKVGI